jgi:hypothetical protein
MLYSSEEDISLLLWQINSELASIINEEQNYSINENCKSRDNKINGEIIFKIEKLLPIFIPKIPKLDKCDNDILKETEAETFKKEKKIEENNINDLGDINQNQKKSKITSLPKKKRRKKKNILRRKFNTDNIRRKIISKFFYCLIKNVNNKLKLIGIKKRFRNLPSIFRYKFISKVLHEKDKSKIDFTFKQLITKNILGIEMEEKIFIYNLNVLKSLNHPLLNTIVNMKFSQLYEEYLKSEDFNDGKMDKNEDDQNYINRCKKKGFEFLNFYKNY